MPAHNRTNDPQVVVTAYLKEGKQGEILTFALRLAHFEVIGIANIPPAAYSKDGEEDDSERDEKDMTASVYFKFRVNNPEEPRNTERGKDPQIVTRGYLKRGGKADLIVCTLKLGLFEIPFIINIPAEGDKQSSVYCKFKVRQPDHDERGTDRDTDRAEAREEHKTDKDTRAA